MLIFFQFIISLSMLMHDLHLSICSLDYNNEENRIEIVQRIFLDDFENALKMQTANEDLNLFETSIEPQELNQIIRDYINSHLLISINNKSQDLELLEYEFEDDAVVIYLYISKVKSIKEMEIFSSMLFELFSDQTNILSIHVGPKKKSARFQIDSKSKKILF